MGRFKTTKISLFASALIAFSVPASAMTTYSYAGDSFAAPSGGVSTVTGTITFSPNNPFSTTLTEADISDFSLGFDSLTFDFAGSSFLDAIFAFDARGAVTSYGSSTEQELVANDGIEQLTLENGAGRFSSTFDEVVFGDTNPNSILVILSLSVLLVLHQMVSLQQSHRLCRCQRAGCCCCLV